MCEEGFVSLTTQYIDGTKLEGASNRYTFVWRKSIEKHKPRLEEHIREVFDTIEKAIEEDNASACTTTLTGMTSEELRERLSRLTVRLNTPDKAVKKPVMNWRINSYLNYRNTRKNLHFVVNVTVIPKPIRKPPL